MLIHALLWLEYFNVLVRANNHFYVSYCVDKITWNKYWLLMNVSYFFFSSF